MSQPSFPTTPSLCKKTSAEASYSGWCVEQVCFVMSRLYLVGGVGSIAHASLVFASEGVAKVTSCWSLVFFVFAFLLSSRKQYAMLLVLNRHLASWIAHSLPMLVLAAVLHRFLRVETDHLYACRICSTMFAIWFSTLPLTGGRNLHMSFLVRSPLIALNWCVLQRVIGISIDIAGAITMLLMTGAVELCSVTYEEHVHKHFNLLWASQKDVAAALELNGSICAMIGCCFEGSCVCDVGGKLACSSGLIDELYKQSGASSRSLLQVLHDPLHVLKFLRAASHSESVRAQSLLVTVQPMCSKHKFEATLYCMSLLQGKCLLVGMSISSSKQGHTVTYDILHTLESHINVVYSTQPEYFELQESQSQTQQHVLPLVAAVCSSAHAVHICTTQTWSEEHWSIPLVVICLTSSFLLSFLNGKRYMQLLLDTLQVSICWCLHALVVLHSLHFDELFMRHQSFIVGCVLMAFTLPAIVDLSIVRFLAVFPMQLFSWCAFHHTVGFNKTQCHAFGLATCFASLLCRWIIERQIRCKYDATQQQQQAQANIQRYIRTAHCLRDSLFDGYCLCRRRDHVIISATMPFIRVIGIDVHGLVPEVLGERIFDKQVIRELLQKVKGDYACKASSVECTLDTIAMDVSTPRKVLLFAVAHPDPENPLKNTDGGCMYVGFQMLHDMSTEASKDSFIDPSSATPSLPLRTLRHRQSISRTNRGLLRLGAPSPGKFWAGLSESSAR